MPCFSPAGRDLGGHWRQACAKAKTLLHFLLTESHSDGALTVGDINSGIQAAHDCRMGPSATVLTTHSFRRAQPSVLEARVVVDPYERGAVGLWNAKPKSHEGQRLSGMPVYAEDKLRSSATVNEDSQCMSPGAVQKRPSTLRSWRELSARGTSLHMKHLVPTDDLSAFSCSTRPRTSPLVRLPATPAPSGDPACEWVLTAGTSELVHPLLASPREAQINVQDDAAAELASLRVSMCGLHHGGSGACCGLRGFGQVACGARVGPAQYFPQMLRVMMQRT